MINWFIPFLLLIVMFFWGGSFIAIKVGLEYVTALELVLIRFLPSALILTPLGFILYKRKDPKMSALRNLDRNNIILLFVSSIFAVPLYHFSLNHGETLIPAGWASLVISLNPACISIFAAILLGEKIALRRWAGIVISLSGLVFISVSTNRLAVDDANLPNLQQSLMGISITLMAVISWGAFVVLSKKLMAVLPPLTVLGLTMAIGTAMMLPVLNKSTIDKYLSSGAEFWWAVAFLSIGCTVISFVIWFWVLSKWRASRAGSFIYMVPMFAIIMGFLYLDEPITSSLWIGAIVVLGGVIIAGRQIETQDPNKT